MQDFVFTNTLLNRIQVSVSGMSIMFNAVRQNREDVGFDNWFDVLDNIYMYSGHRLHLFCSYMELNQCLVSSMQCWHLLNKCSCLC